MLYLVSESTNPYFNIASEEHLLRNFTDDIFLLYRNQPSIIVGKHQNTFAEINYRFVHEYKIPVVRRMSGGGTVFHDPGNLNFTFIQNSREGMQVDFEKFTEPILQALIKLGVPASRSGRNDLLANGFKISGNAEHVYKTRTLHHGTLLFSSELNQLREGLKVNQTQFTDKAVRSVRSKVANISEFIPDISLDTFINHIIAEVKKHLPNGKDYYLNTNDHEIIQQLINTKYSTWEWNYGYSPKFKVVKTGSLNGNAIEISISVEKGVIREIESFDIEGLKLLNNIPYTSDYIIPKLTQLFPKSETSDLLNILLF